MLQVTSARQNDNQEHNRLLEAGVLIPVEEPTALVNQIAVVKKPDVTHVENLH